MSDMQKAHWYVERYNKFTIPQNPNYDSNYGSEDLFDKLFAGKTITLHEVTDIDSYAQLTFKDENGAVIEYVWDEMELENFLHQNDLL